MADYRPLHLVIIDGWHPELLVQERHRLPALDFLMRAGRLDLECVSTFPTVTPSALTTLATGVMPSEHGIRGIMWYHPGEDRYVHYWPSHESLMHGTLPQVMRDIFHHLNAVHLSRGTPTLFERLESAGAVCGSVNFPISRGRSLHRAKMPWLLRKLGGLEPELAIRGPRHYFAGDFLRPEGFERQGFFGRYGVNDRRAGDYGAAMIRRHRPDFSLIYLNEHDMRSHHAGPMGCAYSLRIVDTQLAKLMDAYGSWDRAVSEARWILVGDHAQSAIGGVPDYAVNVYRAFDGLQVAPLTQGGLFARHADLAIAPNDRSALIYLRERDRLADVLEQVASWPSVDQIAWRVGETTYALKPATGRTMRWRPGGVWRDPFGRSWRVDGDWSVLDLSPGPDSTLVWGEYPDPLARLEDALIDGADVVLTARTGYEFTTGTTMGKGNHGSLAREDSTVPLVSVGVRMPQGPVRTMDIAPAILASFGLVPEAEGRPSWSSSVTG